MSEPLLLVVPCLKFAEEDLKCGPPEGVTVLQPRTFLRKCPDRQHPESGEFTLRKCAYLVKLFHK